MDINTYNELYNDFQELYEQSIKVLDDSKSAKQSMVDIAQQNSIYPINQDIIKPIMSIAKYNEMAFDIIDKLENINSEYTLKYRKQIEDNPTQIPKLPQIFILFRKLIRSLHKEDYEECNRLKNKILTKY